MPTPQLWWSEGLLLSILAIFLFHKNSRWRKNGLKSPICFAPSGTTQYILKGIEWWGQNVFLFFTTGMVVWQNSKCRGHKSLRQGWSYRIWVLVTNQMIHRPCFELTSPSSLTAPCFVRTPDRHEKWNLTWRTGSRIFLSKRLQVA